MPISPEMLMRYPVEWEAISHWVRFLDGWKCRQCGAVHGSQHPAGFTVALSCAHLHDPAPENVEPANLGSLCQACHLDHDRALHMATRTANQRRAANTLDIFEAGIGL
jgi:hypothetical protein